MDLLRGLAILLVIVSHATDMATGTEGPDNPTLMAARAFFAPYRMPTLLVLSGMLLEQSLSKGTGAYLIGKVRGIAWPWLVWTPVILVLAGFPLAAETIDGTIQMWLGGVTTWFLTTLGFCYVLALFTRRVPSLVVAALLVAASLASSHLTLVGKVLWFSAFFFIGDWAAGHVEKWLGIRRRWMVLAGAASVAFGVIAVQQEIIEVRYRVEFVAMSLVGVLFAGWAAARVPRGSVVRWVEWIGRNSIVPYVAHRPVIYLLEDLTRLTPLAGHPAVPLIGGAATALVCAHLVRLRPATWWLYQMPWPSPSAPKATAGQTAAAIPQVRD